MANNRIQIKRSTANSVVTGLQAGELAFTGNGNVLFIGNPADGASVRIGGLQTPGTLTANQALVANSTSGIDKIIVANAAISQLNANGATGTAGQILKSGGAGANSYWDSGAATVAGSDTQVQFNDGGVLGADAGLTYNKSTDTLSTNNVLATSSVNATTLSVGSSFVANNSRLVIGTTVGVQANGGIGSAGQVLTSNGTTVFWAAASTADVTGVTAGDGLTGGGTTGDLSLAVGAGNGISVSADAVSVLANSGLVANATGLHILTTGDTTLIANATGLYVNDATISIATSQLTGDVALGTQTSGNYVATITAGAGISGSSSSEGGAATIAVVANSGIVSNATGVYVNTAYIGTLTANNANNLGGQLPAYYTNATNITTGTLPYAQIPANVINTTAAFTRTGITTFSANIVLGSSGVSSNGGFGTAGQVLHSNGTATYWAADDNSGGTVTSIATGNGISGGTITTSGTIFAQGANGITVDAGGINVRAGTDGGLLANATGVWVVAGSGLLTNATGVHVGTGNGTAVDADSIRVLAGTNGGLVSNSTGVYVTAANGLFVDSTGVNVGQGNGISVSADAVAVNGGSTLTVNTSGVHVNSTLSITDLTLSGNLTVLGDLVSMNVATVAIEDPLITLAKDQSNTGTFTDALDIGFFGTFGNTANANYTGLFRDQSDSGIYKLFTGNIPLPGTTVDTANVNYRTSTLQAFLLSGGLVSNSTVVNITANSTLSVALVANSLTLTTALGGTSGGTGKKTMTNNAILVGNSTNGYNELVLNTNAGYVLQSNGTALVYDYLDGGTF
jgi:hypothetical protein